MSDDLTKKYYKIGEVAEIVGLPESTLRFWESRLTIVKPRRNERGTRRYTPEDVEKIRMVSFLVKEKGLRLEAAEEQLRSNRDGIDRRVDVIERLRNLRSRVQGLLDAIDDRSRR